MKKLLIFMLFSLLSIPLFSQTVNAEIIDPDFPQYSYVEYYLDPWALADGYDSLYTGTETVSPYSDGIYVSLPADSDRIATALAGTANTSIELYDSVSASWIITDVADMLQPGDLITDEFNLTIIFDGVSAFGDLRDTEITQIRVMVLFTQYVTAESRYNYYLENAYIKAPSLNFTLRFYDRLEIIDTQIIREFDDITVPSRDPDPAGYEFVGWRILNNTLGEFDNYMVSFAEETANWNIASNFIVIGSTTYLDVYAYYQSNISGLYDTPTATPDSPGDLLDILGEFGMATNLGLTIVFIGVLLILFGVMALLKLPIMIYFIVGVGNTALFLFLGYLPIFMAVLIILLLLMTLFSIHSMDGGGSSE